MKTFFFVTVKWALACTLLLLLMRPGFRDAPYAFASALPFACFAGGIAARLERRQFPGVSLSAAFVAFLVMAVLAPALASEGTYVSWIREYASLLQEQARGEPVLGWMITAAGLHVYQPLVAAGLAFIISLFGLVIGAARPSLARTWGMGAIMAATVALSYKAMLLMLGNPAVSLGLANASVLTTPALLVSGVFWSSSARP